MGQAALEETALNELNIHFYCQFCFAGQKIYAIGGLCRIAPPNFADQLTIVHSDVRGGSSKPWGRLKM